MTEPTVIADDVLAYEARWIVDRLQATPAERRFEALAVLAGCRTPTLQRAVFALLAAPDAPVFKNCGTPTDPPSRKDETP